MAHRLLEVAEEIERRKMTGYLEVHLESGEKYYMFFLDGKLILLGGKEVGDKGMLSLLSKSNLIQEDSLDKFYLVEEGLDYVEEAPPSLLLSRNSIFAYVSQYLMRTLEPRLSKELEHALDQMSVRVVPWSCKVYLRLIGLLEDREKLKEKVKSILEKEPLVKDLPIEVEVSTVKDRDALLRKYGLEIPSKMEIDKILLSFLEEDIKAELDKIKALLENKIDKMEKVRSYSVSYDLNPEKGAKAIFRVKVSISISTMEKMLGKEKKICNKISEELSRLLRTSEIKVLGGLGKKGLLVDCELDLECTS